MPLFAAVIFGLVGPPRGRGYGAGKTGKQDKTLSNEHIPSSNIETLLWLFKIKYRSALALLGIMVLSLVLGLTPPVGVVGSGCGVAAYLLVNVAFNLSLKGNPSPRKVEAIRQAQLPLELVIFTLAIYLTGGVLTPVFLIYTFSLLVSIVLLDPGGAYRTAGTASVLYCGLALLEVTRAVPYIKGYWGDHDYYETATPFTYALYMLAIPSLLMVAAFMANRICLLISERNSRIESQLRDLRTLYDIANGLVGSTDEAGMTRYLADTLRELQGASMCVISLATKDGGWKIKANSGVSPEGLARLRGVDPSLPGLSELLHLGKPLIMEDLSKYPEYQAISPGPDVKSAYVFPIPAGSEVLGTIGLTFDKPKPLGPEHHALLTTIASQAGAALQRVRLFSEAQRMAIEMSTLYDVGLHTGSTLSADEVIRRTATNIEKLMAPDIYYIALYDDESNAITFEVFVEDGRAMPRMVMDLSEGGLTAKIIQSKQPLLVEDWLSNGAPYNAIAKKVGRDMLSYLGVPMMLQDRVIGVISVQSSRPLTFTPHDESLLMALAAQAGMALENARLHRHAQDQSTLDSMTQVYNHGHFIELVRQAVDSAAGDDKQVSLIMIDVDHFKTYNDTYGHVAGDNVLKLVAGTLKSKVKPSDAVGRWGGEEFAVLLSEAGPKDAQKVARRFRRAIAGLSTVDGHGGPIPSPTISQGISCYPFPAVCASELIEQADAALYHAKEQGRDQLGICETASQLVLAEITAPLHSVQLYTK